MKTIGSELDRLRGIGPGFDFLRLALALSVLFTHSVLTVQGEQGQFNHIPIQFLHDAIIPMFFALSGFLIAGSALRLELRDFIFNRGMRIVPALTVDIFLCAMIIGPIFTVSPLSDYFHNPQFRMYFANALGWIHYNLPGVFIGNPAPGIVNGSLWTIPFEIGCYIIMSALIVLQGLKRRAVILLITLVIFAGLAYSYAHGIWFQPGAASSPPIPKILQPFLLERGQVLYVYFLTGALFYLYRQFILFDVRIFAGCTLAFVICTCGGLGSLAPQLQILLFAPVIVYMTVFIGLTRIPKIPFYAGGDYSYGIYLYGYPLQQVLVTLFPQIKSVGLHFALSVVVTTMVAYISWHSIEKPILGLRRKFSFTARKGDSDIAMPETARD